MVGGIDVDGGIKSNQYAFIALQGRYQRQHVSKNRERWRKHPKEKVGKHQDSQSRYDGSDDNVRKSYHRAA